MLLAALGSPPLLRPGRAQAQDVSFASDWRSWPDVRWAGPAHWGNRLQDWEIDDGLLVCRAAAPNRTLHCLTHRSVATPYETEVTVGPASVRQTRDPTALVGFRLGAKGRFDDYRSAAVHGTGLDVGLDGSGALLIGDVRSEHRLDGTAPVRIHVSVTGGGDMARIELSVRSTEGALLARATRDDLPRDELLGNLALLSHADGAPTPAGPSEAATFDDWRIGGDGIVSDRSAGFGPIMFAQYTLHRGTLKLTAQLAPIERIPGVRGVLETSGSNGAWTRVASAPIDMLSRTLRFRVEQWDPTSAVAYRVRVTVPLRESMRTFDYEGTVAAEPARMAPLKAAVFSCNADHGFPDTEVVRHVLAHDPDMSLFLGDQFYEGSGGFGIQTDSVEEATLDMLHKWYMFGWSYRELFRHVPAAFIPDDHDVYHGNVWGEGGKLAPTDEGWGAVAQDQGGYKMPAEWVNAMQVAQTSHLPDPYDPTPVEQGIDVYYTGWDYSGVSFAILEDRKFKSAPANVLPAEAQVLNGWIQNPDFDVLEHRDPPDASLLGDRQMAFLDEWAEDFSGSAYMKVVLSQTSFAAVHTIPTEAMSGAVLPSLPMPEPGEYVDGDKLAVDMDSNGWPAARRDEVLHLLRRCSAFHIAGDQHLATVVRNGIDAHGDAGYSFTGPALNNIWPRRWWPPRELREAPLDGGPDYTGDFRDGFGNRITVYAAANPRATGLEPSIIRDRVTGYGIVTFDTARERIHIECWPRHEDPASAGAHQYEGWPITVDRGSGDGRVPVGFLPAVHVDGIDDPVVELRTESGDLVYALRIVGQSFAPPVFDEQTHTVRVGDPDSGRWMERSVSPAEWGAGEFRFDFPG